MIKRSLFPSIILSILYLLPFSGKASDTLYVKLSADGANDGSSWENAFTRLDSALANAQYGDEVWVAQGTYFPTFSNRTVSKWIIPKSIFLAMDKATAI